MSSSESDLIERLRQANRRWRMLALSAVAALALVGSAAAGFVIVEYQRAKSALREAQVQLDLFEQARDNALRQAEQARRQAEQALYAAQMQAAQNAAQAGEKPNPEK
jgi:hypothetical protein